MEKDRLLNLTQPELGKAFREWRDDQDISRDKLSRLSGISQITIESIERGKRNMGNRTRARLESYLSQSGNLEDRLARLEARVDKLERG